MQDGKSVYSNLLNLKMSERPLKILALGDIITAPSGVGNISRIILTGLAKKYNWDVIQLGGGVSNHPSYDSFVYEGVRIHPVDNYGNKEILKSTIENEKPDAIWIITDPRYYEWLFVFRDEIKIPIIWYLVWDEKPTPYYNLPMFACVDGFVGMSKLTQDIVSEIMLNKDVVDYVPLCVEPHVFYPLTDEQIKNERLKMIKESKIVKEKDLDDLFIIYWQNKNMIRKRPLDLMRLVSDFAKSIDDGYKKVVLLMKSEPVSMVGTDLYKYHYDYCRNLKTIWINSAQPRNIMNVFNNISNVTINIASNEGFGLNVLESLMAGRLSIMNKTGGLQDQAIFDDMLIESAGCMSDTKHTEFYHDQPCDCSYPVIPSTIVLKGSVNTPYIFDMNYDHEKSLAKLIDIYNHRKEYDTYDFRLQLHNKTKEIFDVEKMVDVNANMIKQTIKNYVPRKSYDISNVQQYIARNFGNIT